MTLLSSSSSSSSLSWLPRLPVILIATSSLLADRSIRQDLIQERLRCQIWLWLAVALALYNPSTTGSGTSPNSTTGAENELSSSFLIVFETWIHLILFSNVMVIVSASSMPNNTITASSSTTIPTTKQIILSMPFSRRGNGFINLLPFASWCAMMSTFIIQQQWHQTNTDDNDDADVDKKMIMVSVQVFVVAIAVLHLMKWHFRRKRKLSQELRGISGGTGTNSTISTTTVLGGGQPVLLNDANRIASGSSSAIDESVWYTWNVTTTMNWILSSNIFLEQRGEGDDENNDEENEQERDYLLSLLAPHRISGDILDRLVNPSELVHQLNFPYGPACRLAQAIDQRLLRMYPKPRSAAVPYYDTTRTSTSTNSSSTTTSTSMDHPPHYYNSTKIMPLKGSCQDHHFQQPHQQQQEEDWLSLHDREYNQWARQSSNAATPLNQQQQEDTTKSGTVPPMDPEQQARLESMMKERYGLELPQLAATAITTPKVPQPRMTPDPLSQQQQPMPHQSSSFPPANPTPRPYYVADPVPVGESGVQRTPQTTTPATTSTISSTHHASTATALGAADSFALDNPLLQSIYNQMPPHIQEVARRQPELVQRLLEAKKQQERPLTIYEEGGDEGEGEELQLQNDETTRLIQRRPRPKYEAVNGRTIGGDDIVPR